MRGLRSAAVLLCMFTPKGQELERGWPGRIDGDRVIQLASQTVQSFFTGGGTAREHAEFPLAEVRLLAPVLHPPSVRHFDATAGGDAPTFHFGNPASIYGPDDAVPYPAGASGIAFELELAAVIGADEQIGGFTIMNDWFAPDLQPSKHRDFATSLGPVVVTPDELGEAPEAVVRVNGEVLSRADVVALRFGWPEMVERAALNTRLLPGDVLGRGRSCAATAGAPPGRPGRAGGGGDRRARQHRGPVTSAALVAPNGGSRVRMDALGGPEALPVRLEFDVERRRCSCRTLSRRLPPRTAAVDGLVVDDQRLTGPHRSRIDCERGDQVWLWLPEGQRPVSRALGSGEEVSLVRLIHWALASSRRTRPAPATAWYPMYSAAPSTSHRGPTAGICRGFHSGLSGRRARTGAGGTPRGPGS